MKLLTTILLSSLLLTGCLKYDPKMDEKPVEVVEKKVEPQEETTVPEQDDDINLGIQQRILNFETNKEAINAELISCVKRTDTFVKEVTCTDSIYTTYNAINPSITSARTDLYDADEIKEIGKNYNHMLKVRGTSE